VPELAFGRFEPHDRGLSAGPSQYTAVGELPAAAGIKRRLRQQDPARPGVDNLGLDNEGLGMIVTE
jgi:hypothetical protein